MWRHLLQIFGSYDGYEKDQDHIRCNRDSFIDHVCLHECRLLQAFYKWKWYFLLFLADRSNYLKSNCYCDWWTQRLSDGIFTIKITQVHFWTINQLQCYTRAPGCATIYHLDGWLHRFRFFLQPLDCDHAKRFPIQICCLPKACVPLQGCSHQRLVESVSSDRRSHLHKLVRTVHARQIIQRNLGKQRHGHFCGKKNLVPPQWVPGILPIWRHHRQRESQLWLD